MSDEEKRPAALVDWGDGELHAYDEIPAGLAATLLNTHAMHGGIFWVPDCAECQRKWPNSEGWGS